MASATTTNGRTGSGRTAIEGVVDMAERKPTRETTMRRAVLTLAASLVVLGVLAIAPGAASAIEIRSFIAFPSLTQAGGHPDLTVKYAGETRDAPQLEDPCQCNDPREIKVSLPTGFIGNPHATPQCKAADLARLACPADSQVGTMDIAISNTGGLNLELAEEPIYNTVPRPDQPGLISASFAAGFFSVPFYINLTARTGSDYGLDADANGLERQFVVQRFTMHMWGVPADDSHNAQRYGCQEYCQGVPSSSPHIPFLINPGTCGEATESVVTVVGYDNSVTTASYPWPASTGCDQLTFNPSQSARPTTTQTDSASGVDIDLTVPQILSPKFPSPSEIREATLTLPVGFSINPNAADGKTSCSDAAIHFHTTEAAECPEYSKIGTDVIDSPALPEPISGGIYLGDPQPGNRYRIFLTASGYGTNVKLAGTIKPDPQTGQLVTSFTDLPQSPLQEFQLHFFGAERAVLATPTQCGTYAVQSTFVPWDEALPSQSSTQFFNLDSGPDGAPCPPPTRPFAPGFSAASAGNTAGSHSPFTVDLTRNDGDQNLSGLTVTTPPGFSATLAGIPYCPESALATLASSSYSGLVEQLVPSCPVASQIGTSDAGAGAGTHPVYLPGKVYLAGPYKGAPLSLVIVTPAVSGPYDLGNVVVRVALNVDPVDAHVTAVSDPLPSIVEGVPLRLRAIRVSLDRPDFTLNPTNCDRFQVSGAILGDQGTEVDRASHFQVANCAILPYGPGLSMRLTGGVNRRGHPAIHTTFTTQPGEANSRVISVALPKGEQLDNSHLGTVCTKVDFAKDACPAGSRIGNVTVDTPLLDQPLKGYAYLRSSQEGLPDLALKLTGQVDIEAAAKIDSVNEGLRATFKNVPDVPFSTIRVNLAGGKKGLLQNSEGLCGAQKRATVRMRGQNGAALTSKPKLEVSCGGKGRHKRHLRHRRLSNARVVG
jgi:hypothetical protein